MCVTIKLRTMLSRVDSSVLATLAQIADYRIAAVHMPCVTALSLKALSTCSAMQAVQGYM